MKIFLVLVLVFIVFPSSFQKDKTNYFNNLETLKKSEFSSWIPSFLPNSIFNIYIKTDVETNFFMMSFDIYKRDLIQIQNFRLGTVNTFGLAFFNKIFNMQIKSVNEISCYKINGDLYLMFFNSIKENISNVKLTYIDKRYYEKDELCEFK